MKLNKRIKDLTPEEGLEIKKILENCQIIAFDIKEINEKITLAYNLRQAAHETLLESDKLLDEVLKELRGIKTNEKTNGKRNGKVSKGNIKKHSDSNKI
jgi:hypothetical protein